MAKLIWGIDPLAVSRLGRTAKKPPFTKKEAGAHRHSGAQDSPRAGGAGAIDGR